MKKVIYEWIEIVLGLLIFSFGIHLTIQANIGLAPWDILGMGVSYHTPLSYGLAMTIISVIILCIDLILKENIGFGTVIDAFCTGNFINFFISYSPIHSTSIVMSVFLIILGLVIAAIGQFFYMRASQGCGPRDAFLVGVGKRLSHLSIGTVSMIIYIIVFTIGVLLGGPVGLGTVICVFGSGVVMDIVFKFLRFDPRSITHRNLLETVKEMKL